MLLRKPVSHLRADLLLGSALLLCPCHLPVLLTVVAGGLGSGAVAGVLSRNMPLVLALATGYFVFALWLGQRLLRHQASAATPGAGRHEDCCQVPAPRRDRACGVPRLPRCRVYEDRRRRRA